MKTKAFLLATAGSTVDGRVIDDKMIEEMASSYDPMTYGARLNIEHVRGWDGTGPFRAFGDVLELSVGETTVNFNGKPEKRKALFGVFDVTEDAKKLNDAGQKVYPSVEIEPNFGGKGFAYMMGCALTDSPASIATERLKFNRSLPGTFRLSHDTSAALEFAEEGDASAGGGGFLNALNGVLDRFADKFGSKEPATPPAPPASEPAQAATFDFATLRGMFTDFGQTVSASIDGLRNEVRTELDGFGVKLKKIEDEQEGAPAPSFRARPQATGNKAGDFKGIF
jgi:hypothetical protein